MFFRAMLVLLAVLLLNSPAEGVCPTPEKLLAGEKILYDVYISRYGKVGESEISIRLVDSQKGLYLAEFFSRPQGLASVFSDVSREIFVSTLKLEERKLVSQSFYNETHYGSTRILKTEFSFDDQTRTFVKKKYDGNRMKDKKTLADKNIGREDLLSVFFNLRHRFYGVLPDGVVSKIRAMPFALGDKGSGEESVFEIKLALEEEANVFRKIDARGSPSKYLLFFKIPHGLFMRGAITGRAWSNECLLPEFIFLENATRTGDNIIVRSRMEK